MSRLEVITSVQRRRRWSRAEKERLVAATLEPGVTVSEVSQAAGVHSSQLFRWRKELCRRTEPGVPQLIAVEIAPTGGVAEKTTQLASVAPPRHGMIEIELAGGCRVAAKSGMFPSRWRQRREPAKRNNLKMEETQIVAGGRRPTIVLATGGAIV